MNRRIDPEGAELEALERFVSLGWDRLLDVGCGDGRLTARLAKSAKETVGIDPVIADVERGWKTISPDLRRHLTLLVGTGESLPFPEGAFDAVFFSWSLCCMASTASMKASLHEAWRILRPKGILVNLQPSLYQPFDRGEVTYMISGEQRDLVLDEGSAAVADARFALEHATLFDEKFEVLGEAEFEVHTYYDTVEELLDRLVMGREEAFEALSDGQKEGIRQKLASRRTSQGILRSENAILTALRRVG